MRAGINQLAFAADWVFPGLEEGRLLTGLQSPEEIARYYREHGARLVVIKLGADGAYFDNGAEQAYVPGCPVDTVVDTVGAGDGRSEAHTSELQTLMRTSYAVFCLNKKNNQETIYH